MTILYKLTRTDGTSGEGDRRLLWGPGVTHRATGEGIKLCTVGVIHAYAHPLLAVLFNPGHAAFANPRLWRGEGDVVADDGAKVGVKMLTAIEETPLPQVSMAARVHWAILCAMQVCDDADWRQWAGDWINGTDRSPAAAEGAARAGAAWAARAAWAAAWAARAAWAAAWAAWAAAWAARAAAEAAEAARPLDLVALAEQAMEAEQ